MKERKIKKKSKFKRFVRKTTFQFPCAKCLQSGHWNRTSFKTQCNTVNYLGRFDSTFGLLFLCHCWCHCDWWRACHWGPARTTARHREKLPQSYSPDTNNQSKMITRQPVNYEVDKPSDISFQFHISAIFDISFQLQYNIVLKFYLLIIVIYMYMYAGRSVCNSRHGCAWRVFMYNVKLIFNFSDNAHISHRE